MTSRADVVAAARKWLGTPYHHRAQVPGAGVDCLMLIVAVFQELGVLPANLEVPEYPPDIMFHRYDTRYVDGVLEHADEVLLPRPGDVALWEFGLNYSHGAIVLEWPRVLHAYAPAGACVIDDVDQTPRLLRRSVRFFAMRGLTP